MTIPLGAEKHLRPQSLIADEMDTTEEALTGKGRVMKNFSVGNKQNGISSLSINGVVYRHVFIVGSSVFLLELMKLV